MKTFVLVTCLIMTVVFAVDFEKVRQIGPDLEKCAETLPKCGNEPKDVFIRPDVWYCVLTQYGIIDKKGVMMHDKAIALCDVLVSDPNQVAYCNTEASKCIEKANQGSGSDSEKSRAKLECAIKSGLPNLIPELT